jgi:glycosyltransferase involved in cell wall biosynthesis
MRLLLFNLVMDADDPVLGFATRWVQALANHVERVHVLTMRAERVAVPGNVRVHSVGKERGYSEGRRAFEFYRCLLGILRRDRIDVCFSHMIPIFTVLAAPVLGWKRIPILTWYAHPSRSWQLRLAHRVSDRVVTSVRTAYPYKDDKLTVIGQGIDVGAFCPAGRVLPDDPPVILCAGRLSPVKDHPTLLRAAALLRDRMERPFRVVIVGGPTGPRDEGYMQSLRRLVSELRLEDIVRFEGPVTMGGLPSWYRRATVHVNMTPTGFGDKVALEAMACGTPTLVANVGFKETLGQWAEMLVFPYGDEAALAEKLEKLVRLPVAERNAMGLSLRERVVAMHSLDGLAQRLVDVFRELEPKGAGPGIVRPPRSR